jgi:hypothetical protein
MGKWEWRLRAFGEARFGLLVAVLVTLLLVGSVVTAGAYGEPETAVEERPGPESSYTGAYDHEAEVVEPNPVYDVGIRLTDRSVYFSEVTPTLAGTFTYHYQATSDGEATVTLDMDLVIRSVETTSDAEPTEYWRVTRDIDRTTATVGPDEVVSQSFSENVTRLANESQRIDEAVGGTPGDVRTSIVTTVTTEGTVDGRPVEREQRYNLPIRHDQGVYQVGDGGPVTNWTQQFRTVTVEQTPGPLRRIGGPLLIVLALFGLGVLGVARHQDRLGLEPAEREYLAFQTARQEFDDWITTASLPDDSLDRRTVEVETLGGLVDLAIDSDRRVLTDPDGSRYVVVLEDVVYRYTAPPEPAPRQGVLASFGEGGDGTLIDRLGLGRGPGGRDRAEEAADPSENGSEETEAADADAVEETDDSRNGQADR